MEGKQKPGIFGNKNISSGTQTKQTSNWGTLLGRTGPTHVEKGLVTQYPPKGPHLYVAGMLGHSPHNANLARRKVRIDTRCSLCCQ